jgi:hypothetical protein
MGTIWEHKTRMFDTKYFKINMIAVLIVNLEKMFTMAPLSL